MMGKLLELAKDIFGVFMLIWKLEGIVFALSLVIGIGMKNAYHWGFARAPLLIAVVATIVFTLLVWAILRWGKFSPE